MDQLAQLRQPILLVVALWQALDEHLFVSDELHDPLRYITDVGVELLGPLSYHSCLIQHCPDLLHLGGLLLEDLGVVLEEPLEHAYALDVHLVQQAAHDDDEVLGPELILHGLLVLLDDVGYGKVDRPDRLLIRHRLRVDLLAERRRGQLPELQRALLRQGLADELHVLLHALASKPKRVEQFGEARNARAVLGRHGPLEALAYEGAELGFRLPQHPHRGLVRAWRQGVL
mmetsp:Transcript_38674/g.103650  ORF Transcript_38674/g.103650 Transcript_38674/m.103650 type:complete len:230 (-) Transcript_38674:162-851(-)